MDKNASSAMLTLEEFTPAVSRAVSSNLFQGFICTTDFEVHINSKTISVLIIQQFLNESARNFEVLLKAARAQG